MMKVISTVLLCASALFVSGLQATAAEPAADKQAGIQFAHGSWKEVLDRAKKENKLVFIDVYTSWCGPCKKMAAEVFPQKQVGDVFNASFINYKIDAEKGEGIDIAKTFEVRAFPTYLFVDGNGQLVYRTGSYQPAEHFIQEANIAIREKDDPKPLGKWVQEYESGKRDKAFLLGYLNKRAVVKVPSPLIIEEVFGLLGEDDLKNKDVMASMLFFDPRIEYVPGGKLFSYVAAHYKEVGAILGNERLPLGLLQMGTDNYFRNVIVKNQDEKSLPVALDASRRVAELQGDEADKIAADAKRMVMKFQAGGHDQEKIIAATRDYVQNGLYKLDLQGMLAADAADYEKARKASNDGAAAAPQLDERFRKANRMISVAYSLRDAAEVIYQAGITDPKVLAEAEGWVQQAAGYLPHFSISAVQAGLLFKEGRQQQAVALMKEATEDPVLENAAEVKKLLLANVDRLEQGEAPKHLWNQR